MPRFVHVVPIVLVLSACTTTPPADTERATATLRTASGAEMGIVVATAMDGGVQVRLAGRGLPPGVDGAHIHAVGRCDAPDFASAGGHWNPTASKHGTMSNSGHGPGHAGDLPNLTVAANGTATLDAHAPAGSFAELLDADGAAFVIHAGPDDLMTDPSGNSGARIACGVFARR